MSAESIAEDSANVADVNHNIADQNVEEMDPNQNGSAAVAAAVAADATGPAATAAAADSKDCKDCKETVRNGGKRVPYSLNDHCKYLELRSAVNPSSTATNKNASGRQPVQQHKYHHHCLDVTHKFIRQTASEETKDILKDLVRDFCSPFAAAELGNWFVGLQSLKSEPLTVRTITMRVRPDASTEATIQAIEAAFKTWLKTVATVGFIIQKDALQHAAVRVSKANKTSNGSTSGTTTTSSNSSNSNGNGNCFQAIATLPRHDTTFLMDAQIVTSKSRHLERVVLIRFYHATDVLLDQAILNRAKQIKVDESKRQYDLVRNDSTDGAELSGTVESEEEDKNSNKLREACSLIQVLDEEQIRPNRDFKRNDWDQEKLSKHLMANFTPNPSIQDENEKKASTKGLNATAAAATTSSSSSSSSLEPIRRMHPALSDLDWHLITSVDKLLEACYDELEMEKLSYNTLLNPMDGYGLRPPFTILDNSYCRQLGMLALQDLVSEIQISLPHAVESHTHSTAQHKEFLSFLHLSVRKYHVILPQPLLMMLKEVRTDDFGPLITQVVTEASNVRFEQPWPDQVQTAIQNISNRVSESRGLPQESVELASDAVHAVMEAFQKAADEEQKQRLKSFNRTAMKRLLEQHADWKSIVHSICNAKTRTALLDANHWYGIAQKASNKEGFPRENFLRPEVPLIIFDTFTGSGCVTANNMICTSRVAFSTTIRVFELKQVDLRAFPNHAFTKLGVFCNGKRLHGFNPSVGAEALARFVQFLS